MNVRCEIDVSMRVINNNFSGSLQIVTGLGTRTYSFACDNFDNDRCIFQAYDGQISKGKEPILRWTQGTDLEEYTDAQLGLLELVGNLVLPTIEKMTDYRDGLHETERRRTLFTAVEREMGGSSELIRSIQAEANIDGPQTERIAALFR